MGKTGKELNRYLDGINLPSRQEVYLTNLYREYRGKGYEYTESDLSRDGPELRDEVERVCPTLVITLGRHSTRFFLGDVDMESTHAIAWRDPTGDSRTIFPIFHPAAAFHNPEISSYVAYGFQQLAAFLKGDVDVRTLFDDPYEGNEQYEEITTSTQLHSWLRGVSAWTPTAIDTEGTLEHLWSLQFAAREGSGALIRQARRDLIRQFGDHLDRVQPRIIFHNALYDLGMMRAMGIPWDGPFDDTMVMAYLLQIESQALKPLCVRHCGMKMQSYEDIIGSAGELLASDYLWSLFDIEELDYEQTRLRAFAAAKQAGRRVKVLPKLPRTTLHKAVERCLTSKDARKLWHTQIEDEQHSETPWIGKMPQPTLDHVDPGVAVRYGCRDADGTLRLYYQLRPRLEAMGLI